MATTVESTTLKSVDKGVHMMSVLKIHSIHGDDEFSWDPSADDHRLWRAKQEFERARKRQLFAYSRLENGDTQVIDDFDPRAREILMTTPLSGG
jgi:hypothetical protein